MRQILNLKDNWKFVKEAINVWEAEKAKGIPVCLPHTWNALDGQDGGNDYYRGTCWYTTNIKKPDIKEGSCVYIEFLGAAMIAEVYLNGEKLARHEGGYSTFRVDVTGRLLEENSLAVSLDNSDNDFVYPQKADFTFYGGLYRMVNLIIVPKTHFDLEYAGGKGIKVTPVVHCDEDHIPTGKTTITVETWVKGAANTVTISITGEETIKKEATVVEQKATAVFKLESTHLWNGVKEPYLYRATAQLKSGDIIETRFGCRSFYTDPERGFILNGRAYPLRGVSRHQDRAGVGNALTYEMHKEDIEMVKEIGANTIRLAHYQHAQEFYDLCDEYGIVVWAEIPFITLFMKNGQANTLSQMEELVIQNYNHASIICWGLSNEITAASPVEEALLENHRLLNRLCHKLDKTRFTTIANVFMQETNSPLLEIPDVNSYNLYFGWYLGELEQNEIFFDEYHTKYPERCIGFSEYGADANPKYQSSIPSQGDYSESYQTVYHEYMLHMIEKRPYLWATHLWNLFDFAADGRDEGGKHGENQKGLVTLDRKTKKDTFYLYKAYWNKEDAFVHICGKRNIERTEEKTEVKVYSNQSQVSLFSDGILLETQKGNRIFRFTIKNIGEQQIIAKAGALQDETTIRKVTEPNMDYVMGDLKEVINWFDKEAYKPDCYSIKDKMSDLQRSKKAGAILAQIMEQGAGTRGDVAESVKDNPNLVRMMGRMTLESILGHMKDSITKEQMEGLNQVLQQIKKGE